MIVDQRGLRRGFAGTGRAGDKDKPAAHIEQIPLSINGIPEFLELAILVGISRKAAP